MDLRSDAEAGPVDRFDDPGRTHAEKAALAQDIAPTMVPLPARGLVRVAVDSTFPPDRYRDAYDRLAEAGKLGKVILTCE